MTYYATLKLMHIISSTLLFGTGLGTAFFMLTAYRSRNLQAITVVSKNVILADWLFTTPAVIIQPLTGILLVQTMTSPWPSFWIIMALILYGFVGACWLPVVAIQIKLHKIAKKLSTNRKHYQKSFIDFFVTGLCLGGQLLLALSLFSI